MHNQEQLDSTLKSACGNESIEDVTKALSLGANPDVYGQINFIRTENSRIKHCIFREQSLIKLLSENDYFQANPSAALAFRNLPHIREAASYFENRGVIIRIPLLILYRCVSDLLETHPPAKSIPFEKLMGRYQKNYPSQTAIDNAMTDPRPFNLGISDFSKGHTLILNFLLILERKKENNIPNEIALNILTFVGGQLDPGKRTGKTAADQLSQMASTTAVFTPEKENVITRINTKGCSSHISNALYGIAAIAGFLAVTTMLTFIASALMPILMPILAFSIACAAICFISLAAGCIVSGHYTKKNNELADWADSLDYETLGPTLSS